MCKTVTVVSDRPKIMIFGKKPIPSELIKNGPPRPLLSFIFDLFKQTLQFLQQYIWKDVHPAMGAGIQTQDHLDVRLLP